MDRSATVSLNRTAELFYALIPLGLAAVVYLPLTHNYFVADDFLHLYQIENLPLLEFLFKPHGGHALAVRNTLFFLCAKMFGTNAALYFWVVLLTHLLNVFLLFQFLRVTLKSHRIACFGATLWGTAPLHEGSLGWYSVYGHVVVGTILLVVLCQASRLAEEGRAPTRRQRVLWVILALAASASFGIGIGLAFTLPLILALLLRPGSTGARTGLPAVSLFVAAPLLYASSNLAAAPEDHVTTGILLSIAATYWESALPMFAHLVGFATSRLIIADLVSPASYPDRLPEIGYLTALALSTLAYVRSSKSMRRQVAAATIMVVACYGPIVAGRLFFLAPAFGMTIERIASMPRYHYVGLIPLTMILCIVTKTLAIPLQLRNTTKNVLFSLCLSAMVATFLVNRKPIDHHAESRRAIESTLARFRKKIASVPHGGDVYFINRRHPVLPPPFSPLSRFPGLAAIFIIFYPENIVDGKRIFFYQGLGPALEAARHGRRTATLVVPDDRAMNTQPR